MSITSAVIYRGLRNIDVGSEWADERRRKYLLARAVELPISFDRGVLPEASTNTSPSKVLELMAAVCDAEATGDAFNDWLRFRTGDQIPAATDPDWHFLGHDVCGNFSISALMNCGYSAAEQAS